MVLEQKAQVIVQLCQNEEDGRTKCSDYLPNSGTKTFGNVTVRCIENTKARIENPTVRKTVVEVSQAGGNRLQVCFGGITQFLTNQY
jgi:protein tyrosine phosphatase